MSDHIMPYHRYGNRIVSSNFLIRSRRKPNSAYLMNKTDVTTVIVCRSPHGHQLRQSLRNPRRKLMIHRLCRGLSTLHLRKSMASLPELISQKYSSAYGTPPPPSSLTAENKHLLFTHSVAKIVTQNNIQVFTLAFQGMANFSSQYDVLLPCNIKPRNGIPSTRTKSRLIRSYRRTQT